MKSNLFILTASLHLLLCLASSDINHNKFPEIFSFGAATSAYQVEGGWDADGKGENEWDHFVHEKPYYINDLSTGDVAADSYHHYLDDVEALKYLGVTHYRFSLSWSRILPTGFVNNVNQAGVDYYKNFITALKENGIEPYVTLYHWDLPEKLVELGGWPNPLLADYFADYARLVFTLFGDDVKNWLTVNEADNVCVNGYEMGVFPPGYSTSPGVDLYLCAHTILKAHAKAYHIYDEEFRTAQNGRISIVIDTAWCEPETDSEQDAEAAERKLQFTFGWFANPVFNGNYPQVMIDRIAERSKKEGFLKSRLPEFTTEEVEYIKGTHDFLALNSYTTNMVRWAEESDIGNASYNNDISVTAFKNDTWESGADSWLRVVPWGMRKLLNWVYKTYNHPEIFITENGFTTLGGLDDPRRINYYTQYLSNILDAIYEDGVNVTGYTVWSLVDTWEWNLGFHDKFGLYEVDFESPNRTRTARKSADFYKSVIASRGLVG